MFKKLSFIYILSLLFTSKIYSMEPKITESREESDLSDALKNISDQFSPQERKEYSESFDYIIHPVSNLYVPNVEPIWKEAYRVLKSGAKLLSSFMNPSFYLFDQNLIDTKGILKVKYRLPYSDYKDLSQAEKNRYISEKIPFEYSHTFENQIGGQLEAGFVITGFYEDRFNKNDHDALSEYMATFMVTCAEKSIK